MVATHSSLFLLITWKKFMIDPNIIHAKTGESHKLSEYSKVEDIAVCPANIASLCICIAELSKERQLWLSPNKTMVQAGLAEVQRMLDEWSEDQMFIDGNAEAITDDMASDMAVFVLQAMAEKRSS
ncbi:hypothetical protein bas69_0047 [Escherichia phage AlfredRasser]|nr:hypothetical protein bas69_0047 [Escherichia phage AlfredRasser]